MKKLIPFGTLFGPSSEFLTDFTQLKHDFSRFTGLYSDTFNHVFTFCLDKKKKRKKHNKPPQAQVVTFFFPARDTISRLWYISDVRQLIFFFSVLTSFFFPKFRHQTEFYSKKFARYARLIHYFLF